jgi:all-trans-retinol 13,14-reductase
MDKIKNLIGYIKSLAYNSLRCQNRYFMCFNDVLGVAICYLAIKEGEMSEKKFDAIVIGSGIGGMSSAASLAMCNYKVLVLEKNQFLGGSMGSYTDPKTGNWKWSPGIQWVCDYSKSSVDYMLLKTITGGKASFSPLDDECQIKYFPDFDYQFAFVNDKDRLFEKLKFEFPEESQKIDLYFKYLLILEKKSGMFSLPKRFPPAIARIMFGFSKAASHPLVFLPLLWNPA